MELDALTPGTLAKISAAFTAENKLVVETENLDGFTLHLEKHPKFDASKKIAVEIDGKKFKTEAKNRLSFSKNGKTWKAEAIDLPANAKQKGAEGPLKEAFASRHVYVYGTLDNPSQEVLNERIKIANEAANWSVYRGGFLGRYMVFPRVVADKELRPSDIEDANLIVLGTKESNAVIAQHQDVLPMHLKEDTEAFGLFYIYPLNGKYIAVSSGLPWWQQEGTSGFNFLPASLSSLTGFKDFILFEGPNKISEGYFTNQWQLPESAKEKVKASGVVEIR